MIINIKRRGKIKVSARRLSNFGKFTGLMFKSRNSDNLLFEFPRDTMMFIHSYFVFFSFLAVWLDAENKVIEEKIVKPFSPSVAPKIKFRKLIEIPINKKNRELINNLLK
ncbi:DUF192 domain-containing protein [Candidatus Pacearchaeota archaeon]|nr:DUF192 domain-containing protein [Candidatus Pacearchaeota archaeon]